MNIERGSRRVGIAGGGLFSAIVFFFIMVSEYERDPSQQYILSYVFFAAACFVPGYLTFKGLVKLIFWIIDGFRVQEE